MSLLTTSVRRHARYLFWGWTFLSSVGATAGAIYGWMQVDNDSGS